MALCGLKRQMMWTEPWVFRPPPSGIKSSPSQDQTDQTPSRSHEGVHIPQYHPHPDVFRPPPSGIKSSPSQDHTDQTPSRIRKGVHIPEYAVKVQRSLAPLSRFRGSHITTAHEQRCRFQSYAKTVPSPMKFTGEIDKAWTTFLGSTTDHVISVCDVWL